MSQLVVGNLDDDVRDRLQDLARSHGRSMEEEAREILRGAVLGQPSAHPHLGSRLAGRFAAVGLNQEIEEQRGRSAEPPDFAR